MLQVIDLEEVQDRRAHREVMRCVVDVVVAEIADQEERDERLDPRRRHEQLEDRIQEEEQQNAAGGRHHEARLVARRLVVDAVEQEHEILAGAALRRDSGTRSDGGNTPSTSR
jgi:hypothetical protein